MKVEEAILGSPFLIVFMVSVDVKQHFEEEGTRRSELRSCVKVEVDVLVPPVPNVPYGLCMWT